MSLFDEILETRAEALSAITDSTTRVPSFPPQMRARWKPLEDAASVSTFTQTVMAMASAGEGGGKALDDEFAPRLVRLMVKSLVQFEVTADKPEDENAKWLPVLGDDGQPLGFDNRMADKLRSQIGPDGQPRQVGKGAVACAIALCGGPAGLVELGMEVAGFQGEINAKVAESTEGSLAARRKTPATAPPTAS